MRAHRPVSKKQRKASRFYNFMVRSIHRDLEKIAVDRALKSWAKMPTKTYRIRQKV